MRAIAIADEDFLVGLLDSEPVDLLLCLGDLWDSTIEKAFDRYTPSKTFGVKGNHDFDAPFAGYVTPLHCAIEEYGGLKFGGFNGCWRYKSRGHYLFDQDEASLLLGDFPRVDVFIAHNSPRGIHERGGDAHQGFDGFCAYIETAQPRYFLHGHQHLSKVSRIGSTEVIGIFGEARLDLAF